MYTCDYFLTFSKQCIILFSILKVLNYGVRFIGDMGCKVVAFLANVSISVSALSLLLITVDRFVAITTSSRRACSAFTMTFLNFVTWIVAAGIAFIYLLGERIALHDKGEMSVCRLFWPLSERVMYVSIVFSIQVVIPLVVMVILYSIMVCRIKSNSKDILLKHDNDDNDSEDLSVQARSDGVAVRILLTVVFVFFVCQLPVNVFFYLDLFKIHNLPYPSVIRVYTFLHMWQMVSNCVNPIIYFAYIRYLHKLTAVKKGTENRAYVVE